MKFGFDAENFFKTSIHIVIFSCLITWLTDITVPDIWPCMFGYCLGQAIASIRRV